MSDDTTIEGRHGGAVAAAAKVVPTFILNVRARGETGYDVTATRLREKEILYLDCHLGTMSRQAYLEVDHIYQRFFETKAQDETWREGHVHALGVELWYRLPIELRDYYWEEMSGLARDASVLIVTEPGVPSFPWELVKPRRKIGVGTDEFLGQAFAMGHWTAGLRWRVGLDVQRFVTLTTNSTAEQEAALAEFLATGNEPSDQQLAGILDLLRSFRGTEYQVASIGKLISLLRVDDGDAAPEIIHLATHGGVDEQGGPILRIALDDDNSRGIDLTPALVRAHARLEKHQPLVFLNACEAGAGGVFPGGRSDGWASVFCEAGGAALVAPRWVVERGAAREAALLFYNEMRNGGTAGRALQALRDTFYQRAGDRHRAAWLAYTLHGHPDLSLGLVDA